MNSNTDKTAGGCVKFPACGCADPFANRWPCCVVPTTSTKAKANLPSCGSNDSCAFHPECGCSDAGNCPMNSK